VRDGVRVETRRFAKQADDWSYVSFVWREDGSDADAMPEGLQNARGTEHDVPDRQDCAFCHVGPADLFLGIGAIQLDAAQQAQLPLSAPVVGVAPGDGNTQATLGYLHGNCGNCHRDGTLPGDRSGLLLDLLVADTDPQAVHAVTSGVLKPAKHVIAGTDTVIIPGDPDQSQLWVRLGIIGLEGMPPSGTEVTNTAGRDLVREWITNLPQ
jgi:mono/diheme cytochrome c family protein